MHPRDFGLSDPNDIGASEYRAIYDCLADALADPQEVEPHEFAVDILDQFIDFAISMRNEVVRDALQERKV